MDQPSRDAIARAIIDFFDSRIRNKLRAGRGKESRDIDTRSFECQSCLAAAAIIAVSAWKAVESSRCRLYENYSEDPHFGMEDVERVHVRYGPKKESLLFS